MESQSMLTGIKCEKCGGYIAPATMYCPHCGYNRLKLKLSRINPKVYKAGVLAIFLIIVFVVFALPEIKQYQKEKAVERIKEEREALRINDVATWIRRELYEKFNFELTSCTYNPPNVEIEWNSEITAAQLRLQIVQILATLKLSGLRWVNVHLVGWGRKTDVYGASQKAKVIDISFSDETYARMVPNRNLPVRQLSSSFWYYNPSAAFIMDEPSDGLE